MKAFLKKNLNVPNVLSFIRLCLVPVYLLVFLKGQKFFALGIFCAASLTDLLDGLIARKYHLITDLGKLLDPLADKLMVITAMFSMSLGTSKIPGVIPLTAVLIVLVKELLQIIGGLFLLKKNIVVHSLLVGKTAHVLFISGLISSYFHDFFADQCAGWPITPDLILIWLAIGMTIIALIFYIFRAVKAVNQHTAF